MKRMKSAEVFRVNSEAGASTGRADAGREEASSGPSGATQAMLCTWKDKGPDLECQCRNRVLLKKQQKTTESYAGK